MPEITEEKFSVGLSVLEMTRTAGWHWLEAEIRKELGIELKELQDFDLEDLGTEQIAAEYLEHRANAAAYKKILFMVQSAIDGKDEAGRTMKME